MLARVLTFLAIAIITGIIGFGNISSSKTEYFTQGASVLATIFVMLNLIVAFTDRVDHKANAEPH